MKVVILAGGEGKRLRPYTEVIPKPLLPIGREKKPVLDRVLRQLKIQGYNDVVLAVNYKVDYFRYFFKDGSERGMAITYSEELKPLGTAGPLKNLEAQLTEDFFVMNGDLITDLDVREVEKFHKQQEADVTIVTRNIEIPVDYGVMEVKGDRVVGWNEKPKLRSEISTGMYMVNPKVLGYVPRNQFYGMNDLVGSIIADKGKVLRFLYDGRWIDIGKIDDFEKAQLGLEKEK
jgi:NDP-sugar pyrophosphorylase family protein